MVQTPRTYEVPFCRCRARRRAVRPRIAGECSSRRRSGRALANRPLGSPQRVDRDARFAHLMRPLRLHSSPGLTPADAGPVLGGCSVASTARACFSPFSDVVTASCRSELRPPVRPPVSAGTSAIARPRSTSAQTRTHTPKATRPRCAGEAPRNHLTTRAVQMCPSAMWFIPRPNRRFDLRRSCFPPRRRPDRPFAVPSSDDLRAHRLTIGSGSLLPSVAEALTRSFSRLDPRP